MRQQATRTATALLVSLFALGALAACDDPNTVDQTSQVPPAEQAPTAEPAPPPAQNQ